MSDQPGREFMLLPDDDMPAPEHEEWFQADIELAGLADLLERKAFAPHDREAISSICLPDLEAEELGEEYDSDFEVDPRLTTRFQLWNQRFFGGRLAPYVVRRGPLDTLHKASGYHDKARRTILLADGRSESALDQTLIHEMCHFTAGGWHGVRFRTELARVASMGHVGAARALAALDLIHPQRSRRRRSQRKQAPRQARS